MQEQLDIILFNLISNIEQRLYVLKILKKILFYKSTNNLINILWLCILWITIYIFIIWNYVSLHNIRSPDTTVRILNISSDFIAWTILLIGFTLNFPCKKLGIRFICGIIAILVMLFCLPTF